MGEHGNKINKICDYIAAHLDEDLSIKKLSDVANFSMHHFHRLFFYYVGVNVHSYIQMSRLKRASHQLAFKKDLKIIDIALEARFENPESFSRAFKKIFGQTPSQFRKAPDWPAWCQKYQFTTLTKGKAMIVDIVDFDRTMIAVFEHRGSPDLMNESITRFIEWRKATTLSPVKTRKTFGIAYCDPKTTAAEAFRFDICGEVTKDIPENSQGVIQKEIPAGRCAVVQHKGSYDHIDQKIYALYGEWLPSSGEKVRDFPLFLHYHNCLTEVPESALITDIYLPLEG